MYIYVYAIVKLLLNSRNPEKPILYHTMNQITKVR